MKIIEVTHVTDSIAKAFVRLIPQLSADVPVPSKEFLQEVADSPNSYLFIAEDDNRIIGTLTLVVYEIPTGCKAWIEDVVVDHAARGKGTAKQLIEAATELCLGLGIQKVNLTSSATRVDAHGLYKKMGFAERETSVFRKLLE